MSLLQRGILKKLRLLPEFIIHWHNLNNIRYEDHTILAEDSEGKMRDIPDKKNKVRRKDSSPILKKGNILSINETSFSSETKVRSAYLKKNSPKARE